MSEDTQTALPAETPSSSHFIKDYWQAGLLLILVSALAYLPLVTQLGFYHDDWFPILSKVSGVSLSQMYAVDRPAMGFLYTLTYRLLGDAPLGWHLSAWAVRAASGIVFLWLLSLLWARRKTVNVLMSVLFVMYPGFLQTPSASNSLNHFIAFGAALLSIGLGIWAQRQSNGAIKYILIAVAALLAFAYPAISEALIGLEAFRLILSGYDIQRRKHLKFLQSLKSVVFNNLPFLLGSGLFVAYRLFFLTTLPYGMDMNRLTAAYTSDPYGMAFRVLWNLLSDSIEVIFSAWFVPAYHLNLNPSMEVIILTAICASIALIVGGLWLLWVRDERNEENEEDRTQERDFILVGLLGVAITLLPIILVNRSVQFSEYLDRYTLQSSAPAAIFLGGLIFTIVKAPLRWITAAFFIGAAFFTHIPNAAQYARVWEIQKSLWWQVNWRAPGLAQDTLVMPVLPNGFKLADGFEARAPLNLMYDPEPGPLYVAAEVLNSDTLPDVFQQQEEDRNFRNISYRQKYHQLLLLSMPTTQSCVHFIDGTLPEVSALDDALVLEAARFSRIEMVTVNGESVSPSQDIFGSEPEHGWCFFYQKASLARQMGNWGAVVSLAQEAERAGLKPYNSIEWLPFLEAYLRLGLSEDADRLTELMLQTNTSFSIYCHLALEPQRISGDGVYLEMRNRLCDAN